MEQGVINQMMKSEIGEIFDERLFINDVSGAGNNWYIILLVLFLFVCYCLGLMGLESMVQSTKPRSLRRSGKVSRLVTLFSAF